MDNNSIATSEFASAKIYSDLAGLAELKRAAKEESPAAIREVAEQFEALFLKMMLKTMREATPKSSLLHSDQQAFYYDFHDKQLALQLADTGTVGLADLLVQQLSRYTETPTEAETESSHAAASVLSAQHRPFDYSQPLKETAEQAPQEVILTTHTENKSLELEHNPVLKNEFSDIQDFVNTLKPYAQEAAKEIGVDYRVLLAQSALETGWGKKIIKNSNGDTSHNLFGIKSHNDWQGHSARVHSLEFEDNTFKPVLSDFRSYSSFAESFKDYIQFLKNNPRYEKALSLAEKSDQFVRELQASGYASDPSYANKILSILDNTIIPMERSSG